MLWGSLELTLRHSLGAHWRKRTVHGLVCRRGCPGGYGHGRRLPGSGAVGELSTVAQRILVHTQFTKYATDFIPVDMFAAERALGVWEFDTCDSNIMITIKIYVTRNSVQVLRSPAGSVKYIWTISDG